MIRLTLFLLAGIGGAMFMADHFPDPASDNQIASISESAIEVAPLFDETKLAANTEIVLASAQIEIIAEIVPAELATIKTPAADGYVPFSQPILIGDDGEPVVEPTAVLTATAQPVIEDPAERFEVRYVSARRVNVRLGPSTNHAVVGGVIYAEAVQVLGEPSDGWVQIRIEGDGVEGFMAARFLQEEDPLG